MKFPKKLNVGDTVGLICGSSCVSTERIAECVKAVEAMGYKVKCADNLDKNYGGLMAGSGKERADWINKMFADPEVAAIFCVRGGDGSSRTMEYIDYEIVRFSWVTVTLPTSTWHSTRNVTWLPSMVQWFLPTW